MRRRCLILILTHGCLALVLTAEVWAAEPTLARMSFWVPAERMAEFEAVYQEKVVPVLKTHGLVASSERGRETVEEVFSRLFAVKTSAEVAVKAKALGEDAGWPETLQTTGVTFDTAETTGQIQHDFRLSPTPAWGRVAKMGPGKTLPAGRGRRHWRSWNVTDGLPGNSVSCSLVDRDGNLWFGIQNGGAVRYNGHAFTQFTTVGGLANNTVWKIFQDRNRRLWFVTYDGVSRYDGQTWTTFTTKDGLIHDAVRSIAQDRKGNLWFGTEVGLSRLSLDKIGAKFRESGYDGQTCTSFTTGDGLVDNRVDTIVVDGAGRLWFANQGWYYRPHATGVSRYDGKTFTTFTTADGLVGNKVWSILRDRDGVLWFGTEAGVSRYDGETWTTFTTEDGLAHNWVLSIMQDRGGHLWFGTNGAVSWYDGRIWTTFATEDGLRQARVGAMVQDGEGHFWFATNGGISRYDGETFTVFTRTDGLCDDGVFSIQQDRRGHLWFGTWEGVSRYDGQTFTTFTTADGLMGNRVQLMMLDKEGNLWLSVDIVGEMRGGVSRYDGRTLTTFTTADRLADNRVMSMLRDRKGEASPQPSLWFGAWDGSVSWYEGERFTTLMTQDGLAENSVTSMFQDKEGDLWFGTTGGSVSWYDLSAVPAQAGGEWFTTFATQDGLGHNEIHCIFQDAAGHFWFGTYRGVVSRYNGKVFQALTRDDGLIGGSVRDIFEDKDENLWFGTLSGLVRYHQPVPSPPAVEIDRVIADRRYDIGRKHASPLTLPTTVGLVVIEFHGRSFKTRSEAMVYRYRLNGYDTDWKNTKNQRVEYQDLPRGNYTFEVLAVGRDLVYSEMPARVTLNVVPPFYLWASFLGPTVGSGAILLLISAISTVAFVKRRIQVRAYDRAAVAKLRMQMSLMPEVAPQIDGIEIAGRCVPANTVSGDFFDYLESAHSNEIGLIVADVMGKAMKGVMTDGILHACKGGGGRGDGQGYPQRCDRLWWREIHQR